MHPPFRWQREYAREFEAGLTRMSQQSGVAFAVENLYPLRPGSAEVTAYAPHWNPVELDCPHATLDVSHAAVSGSDVLEMAALLGGRLAHVHLGDGTKPGLPDEHLVPGRGKSAVRRAARPAARHRLRRGGGARGQHAQGGQTRGSGWPTWPSRSTSPVPTWTAPRWRGAGSGRQASRRPPGIQPV